LSGTDVIRLTDKGVSLSVRTTCPELLPDKKMVSRDRLFNHGT